jgi:murein DD-endopeptidase MepM/ murein hydrolase activator NlpD
LHKEESHLLARKVAADDWGPGYAWFMAAGRLFTQRGPDGTTSIVRMASHLALILVIMMVMLISRLRLPNWELGQSQAGMTNSGESSSLTARHSIAAALPHALFRIISPLTVPAGSAQSDDSGSAGQADAAGLAAPIVPRTTILNYAVQTGDTLYGLADRYHISADSLVWANNLEANPDALSIGQQLVIPPVDGVVHTVQKGDTLASIAKKYKANASDIVGFAGNALDAQNPVLTVGQKIMVPGGSIVIVASQAVAQNAARAGAPAAATTAKVPANAVQGGGHFAWPLSGTITQRYGPWHRAVDIAIGMGTPVKASDAGFVVFAGWANDGYGYHIIIDHGHGVQTLYAHLSKMAVKAGQSVTQGMLIGNVGSTGNSTGPHLHFEIHINGVQANPFSYLP